MYKFYFVAAAAKKYQNQKAMVSCLRICGAFAISAYIYLLIYFTMKAVLSVVVFAYYYFLAKFLLAHTEDATRIYNNFEEMKVND